MSTTRFTYLHRNPADHAACGGIYLRYALCIIHIGIDETVDELQLVQPRHWHVVVCEQPTTRRFKSTQGATHAITRCTLPETRNFCTILNVTGSRKYRYSVESPTMRWVPLLVMPHPSLRGVYRGAHSWQFTYVQVTPITMAEHRAALNAWEHTIP
jgi:hypothetical protein